MQKIKIILAAITASFLISNVSAQPPANSNLRLSAEDYNDIEQLMYRYGLFIDTCSNTGYDYADLYTEDGQFIDAFTDSGFAGGGIVRAEGREQLAQASGGGELGCEDVGWNGWSHMMINPVIWATEEGAEGWVYSVPVGEFGPNYIERNGGYQDIYVKTYQGWRIKQRIHVRNKAWSHPLLQTEDMN
jgi:hypothetical protein